MESPINFRVIIRIIIISTLITQSWEVNIRSKSYHRQCQFDRDCESSRFLECDTKSGVCNCPRGTVWDVVEESCRTMEGSPCKLNLQFGVYEKYTKDKCVSNTTCINDRCECNSGFLRTNFGTCDLGFDMPCIESQHGTTAEESKHGKCSWRFLLHCSDGACKCQHEHVWDAMRGKCVSLVDSRCDDEWNNADDKIECVDNSRCVNGVCKCLEGYSVTPHGQCLLNYGQPCNNLEGRFCNRHQLLNCGDDEKCGCEFYGQMLYDETEQECRMLAGEFCDLDSSSSSDRKINPNQSTSPIHKCVEFAECGLPHKNSKGKCNCIAGKFQTAQKTCSNIRGHGLECTYSGDCNQTQFLACFFNETEQGRCECIQPDMYFDKESSQCLVYPGRSCGKNNKCGLNSYCKNREFCDCNEGFYLDADKSVCSPIITTTTMDCNSSTESTNGKGVIKMEQDVYDSSASSSFTELTSTSPTPVHVTKHSSNCPFVENNDLLYIQCQCGLQPDFRIWSQNRQACLELVGRPCTHDEICTENAYCDEDKTCQCQYDSRTTLNRTCVLKRNHSHSNKNHESIDKIYSHPEVSKPPPVRSEFVVGNTSASIIFNAVFNLLLQVIVIFLL